MWPGSKSGLRSVSAGNSVVVAQRRSIQPPPRFPRWRFTVAHADDPALGAQIKIQILPNSQIPVPAIALYVCLARRRSEYTTRCTHTLRI